MKMRLENWRSLEKSNIKDLLANSESGEVQAQALRLIAEGKTGESIDVLLASIYEHEANNVGNQFSDDFIKVVFLSNQLRRAETAFLEGIIQFEDYDNRVNKITLSLINFIKSKN